MSVSSKAYTGARAAIPIRVALLAWPMLLAACSVDIPIPGFSSAGDATASIDSEAARLSPSLTNEDWALARAALRKALESPVGLGLPATPAAWGNPNSGLHGTFARDPDPKAQWLAAGAPKDGATCQYFVASIAGAREPGEREGLACRDNGGQWSIKQARERVAG